MNKIVMRIVALAMVGSSAVVHADEILLKPEISALQYVATYIKKMPVSVQKDWLSISVAGRDLLTREAGAIAVTVSDSGTWSYRVPGQITTARYAAKDKKELATDATNVTAVLGSAKVRQILSIFIEPPASISEDVAAKSFQSKLRRIDDGSRDRTFDAEETEALLAVAGHQLSTYDKSVSQKVRGQPDVSKLADKAEAIAASQDANKSLLINRFATADTQSDGSAKHLKLAGLAVLANAIFTVDRGSDKVTVAEVATPNGALILKCEGDRARCTNADGSVRGSNVVDQLFLPNTTTLPSAGRDTPQH